MRAPHFVVHHMGVTLPHPKFGHVLPLVLRIGLPLAEAVVVDAQLVCAVSFLPTLMPWYWCCRFLPLVNTALARLPDAWGGFGFARPQSENGVNF